LSKSSTIADEAHCTVELQHIPKLSTLNRDSTHPKSQPKTYTGRLQTESFWLRDASIAALGAIRTLDLIENWAACTLLTRGNLFVFLAGMWLHFTTLTTDFFHAGPVTGNAQYELNTANQGRRWY